MYNLGEKDAYLLLLFAYLPSKDILFKKMAQMLVKVCCCRAATWVDFLSLILTDGVSLPL